jgi:hypothetical protein
MDNREFVNYSVALTIKIENFLLQKPENSAFVLYTFNRLSAFYSSQGISILARIIPARAKTDINQPAVAILTCSCCISVCMVGGTLNWLSTTTILAKYTAHTTAQALRMATSIKKINRIAF